MRMLAVATGLLTTLGLAVVIVWGVDQNKQADWWAAWGQWVGGAGSIVAAVIALGIAQRGWNLAARESREREAALFAVWVGPSIEGRPVLCYINATALPVYDVVITAEVDGDTHTTEIGTISPTSRPGTADQQLTLALGKSVEQAVTRDLGLGGLYTVDKAGEALMTAEGVRAMHEATNSIQLSTTFRQGKHKWLLVDGSLTPR
jgi:hypothetical protein